MGKFINTQYTDTVNSLVDGFKERLQNNFYVWNDKTTTIVTYYNINTDLTVLDNATVTTYANVGKMSGIKYNKINNMVLYGIDNIAIAIDNGEFGAEAGDMYGDAIVVPNTIQPYVGDYFRINYLKENLLFRVVAIHPDTLENGSNFYKLEYKITERKEDELIDKNIAFTYETIFTNIGTSSSAIILSDKYKSIKKLDALLIEIRKFYIELFYSDRVQTFIFLHQGYYFYDPNMIEFLIRNKILLADRENYIYLTHQIPPHTTFSIDYEKTLFNYLEDRNINSILGARISGYGDLIDSKTNIFSTRYEDYYKIIYQDSIESSTNFNFFDVELLNSIHKNELSDNKLYNIIIKYFNNSEINEDDIKNIDTINYENNIDLFYSIPCVIFCLERYIKTLIT